MTRVKLNDGDGHWIDSDGELITTVWTSEGWKDLPGVYETHSEFLPLQSTHDHLWLHGIDDSLNLTIIVEAVDQIYGSETSLRPLFRKEYKFINVNSADFDEVEDE